MGLTHRGALMTYMDISASTALYGFDPHGREQNMRSLDVRFLNRTVFDKENPMLIEANVTLMEKDFGVANIRLIEQKSGIIICEGTTQKSFTDQPMDLQH